MVFYSDHARINADDPRRTAACERCCTVFNLEDLSPQYRWAGMQLVNTNVYVCARCLDVPAPFERAIILPPDPPPTFLARRVNFTNDAASQWTIQPMPATKMFPAMGNMQAQLNFVAQISPSLGATSGMSSILSVLALMQPNAASAAGMTGILSTSILFYPLLGAIASMSALIGSNVDESAAMVSAAAMLGLFNYGFQPSALMAPVAAMTVAQSYGFQPAASLPATAAMAAAQSYGFAPSAPMPSTAGVTCSLVQTHLVTSFITATGPGSLVVPAGVSSIPISGIGGGGTGASGSNSSYGGGGGGSSSNRSGGLGGQGILVLTYTITT